jgi:hypothetical protein
MAHGQVQGNDEAGGWLGDNPGLAAKLRGAMAFALANGRNRGIVRVDNFAMGQRLTLRQPTGLVCDPWMRLERGHELGVQTRSLLPRQLHRTVEGVLGGPRQRQDRLSHLQQVRFCLAHQPYKHVPYPPTLATEAAHHLPEVVLELLDLPLEGCVSGGALRGNGRDDLEDFFGA